MITHYLTAVNSNNQAIPQEQHEQQKSVIFKAQGEILKGCKGLKCPPRIKVSTAEAAISSKTEAEQKCSCPGFLLSGGSMIFSLVPKMDFKRRQLLSRICTHVCRLSSMLFWLRLALTTVSHSWNACINNTRGNKQVQQGTYFTTHQPGKEGRNTQQNSWKTTQGAEAAKSSLPH
jgi:hypothetical protein